MSRIVTNPWGFGLAAAALGALALFPLTAPNSYFLHIFIIVFIYVILAVGLDLVFGYCGQYSFAQGAFYGIGGYTAAILFRDLEWGFWATLPSGIVVAGLFGLLLGVPSLRLAGHFLAIVTIAFQTIVYLLLGSWTGFTGGQYGIGMPRIEPFAWAGLPRHEGFYYLALLAMALAVLIGWRLAASRIGKEWVSIRDDEMLAKAVGLNTTRSKLIAFVLSAAFAGGAGVLIVYYLEGAYPQDFAIITSATIIAMVVVGGRATIIGPILGAVLFTAMPEFLRFTEDYKLIIYGLLMILAMTFLPAGLIGLGRRLVTRRAD
ncbi:branched-chain amino acid ABC transporter permease [Futiania mangrovi]|uniref:Branched-chain amino acid ABC transporter permease n=1 Tax=Futiania mangrovi TaxID=2959716 RepID=A0A9J6PG97_9PROT|nr:branched-chain amino acid ABC transporter permease [Futiania mangrovii]MCP1335130.1 branched-chain amino acid ABC transporter permease [Futiania mangrovii]